MDIRNLDPKTKNYIKNLEHTIDIQNELIEAQETIIHYQKIQIEQLSSFEYISTLQYRLKAANDSLDAFETGEKYVQMENNFWGIIRRLEARIKDLEAEVARAHADVIIGWK